MAKKKKADHKQKRTHTSKEIMLWINLCANLLQVFSASAVLLKYIWAQKQEIKGLDR